MRRARNVMPPMTARPNATHSSRAGSVTPHERFNDTPANEKATAYSEAVRVGLRGSGCVTLRAGSAAVRAAQAEQRARQA